MERTAQIINRESTQSLAARLGATTVSFGLFWLVGNKIAPLQALIEGVPRATLVLGESAVALFVVSRLLPEKKEETQVEKKEETQIEEERAPQPTPEPPSTALKLELARCDSGHESKLKQQFAAAMTRSTPYHEVKLSRVNGTPWVVNSVRGVLRRAGEKRVAHLIGPADAKITREYEQLARACVHFNMSCMRISSGLPNLASWAGTEHSFPRLSLQGVKFSAGDVKPFIKALCNRTTPLILDLVRVDKDIVRQIYKGTRRAKRQISLIVDEPRLPEGVEGWRTPDGNYLI